MEEEKLFENLMNNLKKNSPEIPSEKILTDEIMGSLEKNRKRKTNKILPLVRYISSAASIFLIGLFIYQYNLPVKDDTQLASAEKSIPASSIISHKVNENNIKESIAIYCSYLSDNVRKNNTISQFKK